MSSTTDGVRTMALAGVGKTARFEAPLHDVGTIQTAATIKRDSTVSDHDPMEGERGHSMGSANASIDAGDLDINRVENAGFHEFRRPTLSALAGWPRARRSSTRSQESSCQAPADGPRRLAQSAGSSSSPPSEHHRAVRR